MQSPIEGSARSLALNTILAKLIYHFGVAPIRELAPSSRGTVHRLGCPVVVIAASAGGVDALEMLLSRLALDSGAAYVIFLRGIGNARRRLMKRCASHTSMPLLDATDGIALLPDHIYFTPSDESVRVRDGALRLGESAIRRGGALSAFMVSLASESRANAVAVILSGAGGGGTLGVRAIREHGGLVIAECRNSAPDKKGLTKGVKRRSACGLADLALPMRVLPERLGRWLHDLGGPSGHPNVLDPMSPALARLFQQLHARSEDDFSQCRYATVSCCIGRRMRLAEIATLSEYESFVRDRPEELDLLHRDLLLGVTRPPAAPLPGVEGERRVVEARRESLGFLRSAIDALDAHTVIVDTRGKIVTSNRAWRDFAKRNGGDIWTGATGSSYFAACESAPESIPEAVRIAAAIQQVLKGESAPDPVEYACHGPDEERWFQATVRGFTQAGERYAVIAHQNVTAVKRATQRETLSTVAAGVAHEFNSLLLAALLQLQSHSVSAHRRLGDASAATKRAKALIQQGQSLAAALLELYATPNEGPAQSLRLDRWVPQTTQLLRATLPPAVKVRALPVRGTLSVRAHALGLEQVLRILLTNAAEAMQGAGQISVEATVAHGRGVKQGQICVRDNGPGLPEDAALRVFDPDFSTRLGTRRSGLGLAIAHRLLEMMDGSLQYEANQPSGSSFIIRLPLS